MTGQFSSARNCTKLVHSFGRPCNQPAVQTSNIQTSSTSATKELGATGAIQREQQPSCVSYTSLIQPMMFPAITSLQGCANEKKSPQPSGKAQLWPAVLLCAVILLAKAHAGTCAEGLKLRTSMFSKTLKLLYLFRPPRPRNLPRAS